MYIGSKIKPKHNKTRTVDVLDKKYVFVESAVGDGHFVCDVKDEEHIRILLSHPEQAFYKYDGKSDLARPPAAPPPPPVDPQVAADAAAVAAAAAAKAAEAAKLAEFSQEVRDEAEALLGKQPPQIGKDVGKVSSPIVIKAARMLENERKDGPRASVVEILDRTLSMLQDAGKGA